MQFFLLQLSTCPAHPISCFYYPNISYGRLLFDCPHYAIFCSLMSFNFSFFLTSLLAPYVFLFFHSSVSILYKYRQSLTFNDKHETCFYMSDLETKTITQWREKYF